MYLIVGLGNPGDQYHGTRHNLGFDIINEFARKAASDSTWEDKSKFKSQVLSAKVGKSNSDVILVKPQTFMNNSGLAVAKIAQFYKISPEKIIIIQDDLDLPVGHLRIRQGGAAGGHHGVESIIGSLNSDNFIRVRVGIGNLRTLGAEHRETTMNVEGYVLADFDQKEKSDIKSATKRAIQALGVALDKGIEEAQKQFNGA